jgi:hypothetical protein
MDRTQARASSGNWETKFLAGVRHVLVKAEETPTDV